MGRVSKDTSQGVADQLPLSAVPVLLRRAQGLCVNRSAHLRGCRDRGLRRAHLQSRVATSSLVKPAGGKELAVAVEVCTSCPPLHTSGEGTSG